MLDVSKFSADAVVSLMGESAIYSPFLESEVNKIWANEQQRKAGLLFNGSIFSVREFTSEKIIGHQVEYRYFLAQRVRPDLFGGLRVFPLAVSGIFICDGGVIFGRRSSRNTQDGGRWELAPSGGIDTASLTSGDVIDYCGQLLLELNEELGIDASAVTSAVPFCLIHDDCAHVLDIGIALFSSLSAECVMQSFKRCSAREYSAICIVAWNEIDDFIHDQGDNLVATSRELLTCYRERFSQENR